MSVEITVPVRVTLTLEDSNDTATFDEIRGWLALNPDAVARAVEKSICARQQGIGWLNDDTSLFIEAAAGVDASAIRRAGPSVDLLAVEA